MFYTCLSDIALFINGIETVKAYRFRVAITIYAVDSVFLFLESVLTSFGAPAVPVKTPGRFLLSSRDPLRSVGGRASAGRPFFENDFQYL